VTKDQPLLDGILAFDNVDVGSANGCRRDPNDRLSGLGAWTGHVLNSQIVDVVEYDRFHLLHGAAPIRRIYAPARYGRFSDERGNLDTARRLLPPSQNWPVPAILPGYAWGIFRCTGTFDTRSMRRRGF
jgi:hypothetical protein